ncbi:MAG TPA: nodulation protein NfeD [Silvibacterium sp.]|nr:nodulation protein NfeD [Silvibacterium sp.]
MKHVVQTALVLTAILVLLASIPVYPQPANSRPQVVVLRLDDTIQPISEEYLTRGLTLAETERSVAVLVMLNTPGGLLDSTRSMVGRILASPVPVIVYVAPSGSRAGSAGFFLLEAADIAAMAPGTNAGAAHPILEGAKLDDIMKQKLENDTTAFLRSYVSRRGRDTSAAQEAVLDSKSYTASEAEQLHLIDLIAPSERELLDAIDGRTINRFNGTAVTLHTRNAELIDLDPTLREKLLDRLMDPNLAVLILVLGGLLIYLEFNSPGTIIPGALGTLFLLTALFALNMLPIRYTALMLLIAAFTLLVLEAKFPSHGVLAATGIVALVFGTLTLVEGPIPEMRVQISTAVACGIAFGLITVFLVRIAIRARRNKVITGPQVLVGDIAVAQQPLTPRGQVLIHGELWQAESVHPAAPGDQVRVRSVHGLTLLVDRIPEKAHTAD